MTRHGRRRWAVALLLVFGSLGAGAYAWQRLAEQSALTTSYSRAVRHRQSLALDAYDLASGTVFFRTTARRLVAGRTSDRERLEALMDWTHENVRPQYAAPNRVVPDTFIDIVRRGHGYCDQAAHVFAALARFAGYASRLLFLRAPDGVSPHTVAEVQVGGRWILVDPWLGFLVLDRDGGLAGVADLGTTASLPGEYRVLGSWIDEGYFRRGTPFHSYPYQPLSEFLEKAWRRVTGAPARETAAAPPGARADLPEGARRSASSDAAAAGTPAAGGEAARTPALGEEEARTSALGDETAPTGTPPDDGSNRRRRQARARESAAAAPPVQPADLDRAVLRLDQARRAHLNEDYQDAIVAYRELLGMPQLPPDTRDAVAFFLGLALLRAGAWDDAAVAFGQALDDPSGSDWEPSLLYYRAEARLELGDVDGAIDDLRAADIPRAAVLLARLDRR